MHPHRRAIPLVALALAACGAPAGTAPAADLETHAGAAARGGAQAVYPGDTWAREPAARHGLLPVGVAQLDQVAAELKSTCLVVISRGVVVHEWYAPGYGPDTVHANAFSTTKSVTSALVGIAQAQGLLDIDDAAATTLEAWRDTPSEAVTVRNLLANDSGRYWSAESDYGYLLYSEDQTAYGLELTQQHAPGAYWEYNNAAIQTLERVLQVATGSDVDDFAQANLFEPIGMTASLGRDAAGNPLVYQGMQTSCHDLARFGYLMLQDGQWDGQQVIPAQWVTESTTPGTPLNDAYGHLWWLNREGHVIHPTFFERVELDGRLVPGSSEALYAAIGAFGQLVVVDPVDGYVVVRMQDVQDLEAAIATDPDPIGITKLNTLMTAFEAAKR